MIAGCILCWTSESSKKRNSAMFVMSCSSTRSWNYWLWWDKFFTVYIPAAPTRYFIEISRVTTITIDLSRLLSSSSQLVKRPGETLIAKTLAAYSLVVRQKHVATTHRLYNDFPLPITKRKPKPAQFASTFGSSRLSVTASHTSLHRERLLSSSY